MRAPASATALDVRSSRVDLLEAVKAAECGDDGVLVHTTIITLALRQRGCKIPSEE